MEPAWIKICGSIFRLTSRTIVQPNGGTREVPCYSLTKTECLYIATKFNDEASTTRHAPSWCCATWASSDEVPVPVAYASAAEVGMKMCEKRQKVAHKMCAERQKVAYKMCLLHFLCIAD